jgi:hypothetical protein
MTIAHLFFQKPMYKMDRLGSGKGANSLWAIIDYPAKSDPDCVGTHAPSACRARPVCHDVKVKEWHGSASTDLNGLPLYQLA